jgi:hypothetical protein
MLPEMFCSANDCACRPATALFNASKIPMSCLQRALTGLNPAGAPRPACSKPRARILS